MISQALSLSILMLGSDRSIDARGILRPEPSIPQGSTSCRLQALQGPSAQTSTHQHAPELWRIGIDIPWADFKGDEGYLKFSNLYFKGRMQDAYEFAESKLGTETFPTLNWGPRYDHLSRVFRISWRGFNSLRDNSVPDALAIFDWVFIRSNRRIEDLSEESGIPVRKLRELFDEYNVIWENDGILGMGWTVSHRPVDDVQRNLRKRERMIKATEAVLIYAENHQGIPPDSEDLRTEFAFPRDIYVGPLDRGAAFANMGEAMHYAYREAKLQARPFLLFRSQFKKAHSPELQMAVRESMSDFVIQWKKRHTHQVIASSAFGFSNDLIPLFCDRFVGRSQAHGRSNQAIFQSKRDALINIKKRALETAEPFDLWRESGLLYDDEIRELIKIELLDETLLLLSLNPTNFWLKGTMFSSNEGVISYEWRRLTGSAQALSSGQYVFPNRRAFFEALVLRARARGLSHLLNPDQIRKELQLSTSE